LNATIPPWCVTRGRTVSGVEFMNRISNTKASRTAADERNTVGLTPFSTKRSKMTFPYSDPAAITINGYDVQ
jgi:hypothetical protein